MLEYASFLVTSTDLGNISEYETHFADFGAVPDKCMKRNLDIDRRRWNFSALLFFFI
jgi:hypothetical protein